MRQAETDFTDLAYNIISIDRDRKALIKSKYCTGVQNIFKNKQNINIIIDCMTKVLQNWLLHINQNQIKLAKKIQDEFKDAKIYTIKPIAQVSGFIAMITVEICELNKLKEVLIPKLRNDKIIPHYFWSFLNSVFRKSVDESMSIIHAMSDPQLCSELQLQVSSGSVNNYWLEDIFPDFSYNDLMKQQNKVAHFNQNFIGSLPIDPGYQPPKKQIKLTPPNHQQNPNPWQANKKGDKNARRERVNKFVRETKNLLKPHYANKFSKDLCADFHVEGLSCDQGNKVTCQYGKFGKKRLHTCICGARHPMHTCKKIWK